MTLKYSTGAILLFFTILLFSLTNCRKDEINTDPGFKLEFSNDTVIFDTVFTSIGSITKSLVIHNIGNKKINIAKVKLARGRSSPFRLNIDGEATEELDNLEIGANDSAYIFVKVTIDPNNSSNPLIESDSVVFQTNGNIQNVKLVAWGQDAYFHLNSTLTGDLTLPNDKPHVIYGNLTVEDGCNLTIQEGTKLYFHNGSGFEVRKGSSLVVSGTLKSPVVFTGDRLDGDYPERAGMWAGIWLENGSKNISFTYAEITNAKVGIQADSTGLVDNVPLRLHNCLIHNMTNYGILANYAKIKATNCQITNCGGNVVSLEKGGDYDFRSCTLARYFGGRGYPTLSISNYTADTNGVKYGGALTGAYFANCIITGNQSNEVDLYELDGTAFVFQFDQCLVDWDKSLYSGTDYDSKFVNCKINKEAKFVEPYKNNFQLDTLSDAMDAASLTIINNTIPDITLDRKGISRLEHGLPDLGAYERVEKR